MRYVDGVVAVSCRAKATGFIAVSPFVDPDGEAGDVCDSCGHIFAKGEVLDKQLQPVHRDLCRVCLDGASTA